jgi:phosphopantothenoylcysteine synthetase/decarboxylase
MKYIYVITGGTLVHISPHLSICAPAYGNVGKGIYKRLSEALKSKGLEQIYQVCLVRTKMAGTNALETEMHLKRLGFASKVETNHDVENLTRCLIGCDETLAIVMAAAICDFEPVELTTKNISGETIWKSFGKNQKRLHQVESLTLTMRPGMKIIDLIKSSRKDIFLVTFKTTAGVTEEETFEQALSNLRRSKSDLVFANDIQNQQNMIVSPRAERIKGTDRSSTLDILCQRLLDGIGGDSI